MGREGQSGLSLSHPSPSLPPKPPKPKDGLSNPPQFTSFCLGLEEVPVLPTQLANLFLVSLPPIN